jgi:tRNA dimethylallyltransferase
LNPPEKKPVALIAGPTASGKSQLAVDLAQRLARDGRRGVVVNADSPQVYRELHILSARPSEGETQGIEHRLFGTWDGAQSCSAADWSGAARDTIREIHASGGVPILCGGTGLYLRTLLEGIAPVPEIDPDIRAAVRDLDQVRARAALEAEAPQAAARLAPADATRTAPALEVIRSTGRTLAQWQAHKRGGIAKEVVLHTLVLLPDRGWLNARCDLRFERMLDTGAIAEVEALLARELDPGLPVMRAIGVREIAALIKGELSRAQAIAAGQLATRQYAKRQYTWFRNQPPADWVRADKKTIAKHDFFVSLFRAQG